MRHICSYSNCTKIRRKTSGHYYSFTEDTSDPGFPSAGNLIELIPNLTTDITNVRSNKLNYDIAMMTVAQNVISSSKTYVPTAQTGDVWDSQVTYEVSAIFVDEDQEDISLTQVEKSD